MKEQTKCNCGGGGMHNVHLETCNKYRFSPSERIEEIQLRLARQNPKVIYGTLHTKAVEQYTKEELKLKIYQQGNGVSMNEIMADIDTLVANAVAKERDRIVEIINKLETVDIKDQMGRVVKEQLISKDILTDLINTK